MSYYTPVVEDNKFPGSHGTDAARVGNPQVLASPFVCVRQGRNWDFPCRSREAFFGG
jgi:hypothetical protein